MGYMYTFIALQIGLYNLHTYCTERSTDISNATCTFATTLTSVSSRFCPLPWNSVGKHNPRSLR